MTDFPRETCGTCDGDGIIIVAGPPVFDMREECWYPGEEVEPCPDPDCPARWQA